MDVTRILAEFRVERERVEQAIMALERLVAGGGKRRGRPPKWMSETNTVETPTKRRSMSAATRAKMAEAQRKRWAENKAES